MRPVVDLIILTRSEGPLNPEVEKGILAQNDVELVVHRVVGIPTSDENCRLDTIVRARNEGLTRGNSRWLMFLDDDVKLHPDCVSILLSELRDRKIFAGLAADYLGERSTEGVSRHVAMGATLFRREVLQHFRFRWQGEKCECQCLCDDMRRRFWGIDYHDRALAWHIETESTVPTSNTACVSAAQVSEAEADGVVMAIFDRKHARLFRERFLASLRNSGNHELVMPIAVGLFPSEKRRLTRLHGVQPTFQNDDGHHAAKRRLKDFQDVLEQLSADTPVAYWDVGDVVFQEAIRPLWGIVRANPGKLLVVGEPHKFLDNPVGIHWTKTIKDDAARQRAFDLLSKSPFLNGGFVAGTAGALLQYFQTVADWFNSTELRGSTDFGDQMALNLYCRTFPDRALEIEEGWNYCLAGRDLGDCWRNEEGTYIDTRGHRVYAVHGNAGTLFSVPRRRSAITV